MLKKPGLSRIYLPLTVNELLQLYHKNPEATLYSGGRFFLSPQREETFDLPPLIISLTHIEELKRITRTERFLECGTSVRINDLLETGRTILSESLKKALSNLGNRPLRNYMTIGSSLCHRSARLDLYTLLYLLDASVELRKIKEKKRKKRQKAGSVSNHWIPVIRLFSEDGRLNLEPGEVLTRIRIPLDKWKYQFYWRKNLKPGNQQAFLLFICLLDVEKGSISNFRLILNMEGKKLFRDKEMEAIMIGKRFPLTEKDFEPVLERTGMFCEEEIALTEQKRIIKQILSKIQDDLT